MKKLKQNLFIILLSLSFAAVALPPDMQADRYLLQAEKALKGKYKDYGKAVESMDKIMALKDQHNLELPIEFYFKYAKLLTEANIHSPEAFTAINHYLTTTGKSGANYAEALDIYSLLFSFQLLHAQTTAEVKKLLELGADVNVEAGVHKVTLLHYAAGKLNNPEIIKALIQAGADVNAEISGRGYTPLYYATLFNNNPEIIKVLIQAGADVDRPTALQRNSHMNKDDKAKVERWLKNPSLLR